jgi:ATP-dependent DNA helicase RecG
VTTSCDSRTSAEDEPATPGRQLTGTAPGVPESIDAPLTSFRGAGPVTAARLAERGIETARDLLMRLPRGYDDLGRVTPIDALAGVADGSVVLVRGTVRRVHIFPRRLLDVFVEEGGASVRARWFRAHASMAKAFVKGAAVALAGPVRTATDGTREMVHPSNVTAALAASAAPGLGLRPRYGVFEGVKGRTLETLRASALAALVPGSAELLPAEARARLDLPTLAESFRRLHAPRDAGDVAGGVIDQARRRLALETLFVTQVAFLQRRAGAGGAALAIAPAVTEGARAQAREEPASFARRVSSREGMGTLPGFPSQLEAALGFALTGSQRRALEEVAADLRGPTPMQRLLVGDVGSGKTAVALGAAALVAAAGGQTLMMVPTEVLAEQQARALQPAAERLGLRLAALTGSTTGTARAALLRRAAAGEIPLLVGTQALLDAADRLPRLGLAIVDEQHRFGVSVRAALTRGSRGGVPHLLSMSATPIPRSLALALHGDLDASFLTERPLQRPAPAAVVCAGAAERRAAYGRLREAIAEGRQAFVVCPVREVARRSDAVTAVAQHARLLRELRPARVGLLHGALAADAKEQTLRAFAAGALDVLVATTVVELGIDVPNATVMIVEDADRFGIAQLHQLRGRVGRGRWGGICFMCAGEAALADDAGRRLALVAANDDGFSLAEADLRQRGAGDLFGTRQAGAPPLELARIEEVAELLEIARREAAAVLAADPALAAPEHGLLARAAAARGQTMFAGDAG